MKTVETAVYGALLLVAAGLSWGSWKGEEPEAKLGSVVAFDPGGAALTALSWDGEKSAAELEFSGKGEDLAVWVKAGKKSPIEEAGDDDSAAGDGQAAPKTTYGEPEWTEFPGNQSAVDLAETFAPLEALREFSDLDQAQLTDMGLDAPEATLTATAGSKSVTLQIGSKAYGSSDTYARADSGRVFLLSSKVLGPLRAASSRLVERDLFGFDPVDATAALIKAPAGSVQAAHQGTHDKDNAYWSTPDAPDEADAGLDGFLDKVLQLRASDYLTADERPENVEPAFAVVFTGKKALGGIELGRVLDEERSKPGEPLYNWFARSERTRNSWVKVSRTTGGELLDQLPGLLGG